MALDELPEKFVTQFMSPSPPLHTRAPWLAYLTGHNHTALIFRPLSLFLWLRRHFQRPIGTGLVPRHGGRRNGSRCPFPDVRGGSSLIVYVLVVIVPVICIAIWACLYIYAPRTLPCSKDYGVKLSKEEEEAAAKKMQSGATSQKRAEAALKHAMAHHSKSA